MVIFQYNIYFMDLRKNFLLLNCLYIVIFSLVYSFIIYVQNIWIIIKIDNNFILDSLRVQIKYKLNTEKNIDVPLVTRLFHTPFKIK